MCKGCSVKWERCCQQRGQLRPHPEPYIHKALTTTSVSHHSPCFVTACCAGEAIAAGVPVAVCSTSNERAVSTIVRVMLGPEVAAKMRVFAGDIVPKKKPDPAIYLLAAKELGVNPARCCVVEDSRIGMLAAKSAGMT